MVATDACTAIGQGGEAASSSIAAEESCQHLDLQLERADFSDLTSHAMENDIVLRPEVSVDDGDDDGHGDDDNDYDDDDDDDDDVMQSMVMDPMMIL